MENTSGQGAAAIVPAEIDGWNWGAFLLNWVWGIGNNTYIAFLMFVPVVNFIMFFVLGAKGSAWAWRNKRWDSIEQFRSVQHTWAKWGMILWIFFIVISFGIYFTISAAFKSSEVFKLAIGKLESDARVIRFIGKPISTGLPMGQFKISGPRGNASISFGVKGPNGTGTVYVEAIKDLGQWKLDRMVFEQGENEERIDLMQ